MCHVEPSSADLLILMSLAIFTSINLNQLEHVSTRRERSVNKPSRNVHSLEKWRETTKMLSSPALIGTVPADDGRVNPGEFVMMRIVEGKEHDENDEHENEHDRDTAWLAHQSMTTVVPSIFVLILQHLRVVPEFKVIHVAYWCMMECRITVGRLEHGLQLYESGKLLNFTQHSAMVVRV